MTTDAFTKAELRTMRGLGSPSRIQRFLDEEVAYNKEVGGVTSRSPRRVLRDRLGHCMEGALLAAAALELLGHEPMLLDLEAVRDDDHVLALFRRNGCWGAVAKSNYSGLRFREPIYRTMRELALSYFEHYFNLRGEKSLRAYSLPVRLKRFDRIGWRTAEEDLWAIPEHLVEVRHYPVMSAASERGLSRMDRRLFAAGRLGSAV